MILVDDNAKMLDDKADKTIIVKCIGLRHGSVIISCDVGDKWPWP